MLSPRTMMWVFGLLSIGGVALFLALYQSSPGPLASPHAKAIPGNMIWSCRQCHAEEGLEAGCISCHEEISVQLDTDSGFHAYLHSQSAAGCETCHPEHHGAEFPLVSAVSWQGIDTNTFDHPHVVFRLEGRHDELGCAKCHVDKLKKPFTLAGFPDQVREHTMLGLNQDCISCHRDVHESGNKTRNCTKCHDQRTFKPAPFFNHDQYYVLEGPHATASCASCHQQGVSPPTLDDRQLTFGPVKGKACADCHQTPHRFEQALQQDCMRCHKGSDNKWSMGERGVDVAYHDHFGFVLHGAHMKVECAKCHSPELDTYAERFPDPTSSDYKRRTDQCSGCHADPHNGQFHERYSSCAACHTMERFMPSTIGPSDHPESYPLLNGHRAVACIQCHQVEPATETRQFRGSTTACRNCHENPHGSQFDVEIARNDCTACHTADFATFQIREYRHQRMRSFFEGRGHVKATCIQCHPQPGQPDEILQYKQTPVDCAACHVDIHRGQFQNMGQTQCERCHGSYNKWTADRFDHARDSSFMLGRAHEKVDCRACHLPALQSDGESVTQYRPLTTKCEDCHGFQQQ